MEHKLLDSRYKLFRLKGHTMGFSSALQGPASHDAILLRIDAELRLLENMKRCLGLRIKSDRKYKLKYQTTFFYCTYYIKVTFVH